MHQHTLSERQYNILDWVSDDLINLYPNQKEYTIDQVMQALEQYEYLPSDINTFLYILTPNY